MAAARLWSPDALAADLDPAAPQEASPAFGSAALGSLGRMEVGLWEMTPGSDEDVESEEVFVVLQGRGHIGFADGSRLDLRPGVVVKLESGDRTSWTVTETLRKLYLTHAG